MAAEDMLKELEVTVEPGRKTRNHDKSPLVQERSPRTFSIETQEPFDWTQQGGALFFGHAGGDSERTTWDFSKSVKENTYSKTYPLMLKKQ